MNKNAFLRKIPKVDLLIEHEEIKELINNNDRELVVDIIREKTEELRSFILTCDSSIS